MALPLSKLHLLQVDFDNLRENGPGDSLFAPRCGQATTVGEVKTGVDGLDE